LDAVTQNSKKYEKNLEIVTYFVNKHKINANLKAKIFSFLKHYYTQNSDMNIAS